MGYMLALYIANRMDLSTEAAELYAETPITHIHAYGSICPYCVVQ